MSKKLVGKLKYLRVPIVCLILLYLLQSYLLFPRHLTGGVMHEDKAIQTAKLEGFEPYYLDSKLIGFTSPNFTTAHSGTVIVLHGNGGWAMQRSFVADALQKHNFRTLLYEYPGYGGRKGKPNKDQIIKEVLAVANQLQHQFPEPIYLWGESIGSGLAAQVLATPNAPFKAAALTLPWSSLADVVRSKFLLPLDILLTEQYDSIKALNSTNIPIVFVWADKDSIIKPRFSGKLYGSYTGPKHKIILKGVGHNNYTQNTDEPWWGEAIQSIK